MFDAIKEFIFGIDIDKIKLAGLLDEWEDNIFNIIANACKKLEILNLNEKVNIIITNKDISDCEPVISNILQSRQK